MNFISLFSPFVDILFDGFQNTIPAYWLIILIAGVLGLSFWTYRNVEGLSEPFRWLLTALRAASFILLLLLILNPVLAIRDQVTSPVRIALLLDNSQSTTIEKGDYDGQNRYEEVINALTPDASGRFEHLVIEPYGFDSELFSLESPQDLDFGGTRTNIDRALTDFLDLMDRKEAVILVTDGIVTTGRDPSATASRIPVPVFTVGVGDTSRMNDVVVQRVTHNPSASLNSRIPVEASILNDGFPDQDITVQLLQNGETLHDTTIRSSEMRSVQQVSFALTLEEEGLQQFQIHVPEIEGEWTTENNTRYFSVDVRDDRIRILHLAYEVHPDVRSLRTFLAEDRQISMENRTWIAEDRYVEGGLPDRPDTLDLIILHGFPHVDLPRAHAAEVADRFGDNALFLIGSSGQDVSQLSTLLSGILPLQLESGFSWSEVQYHIPERHRNHAILDFDTPENQSGSSIRGGIRNVTAHEGAVTLLESVYRGNLSDAPLLAVRSVGDRNISHLNAYNLYRWALSTNEETRMFRENLLNNIVKWTAASPDEELLELFPSDPVYQIGESVIMNGFLRNEAGDPEENAVIDLIIEDNNAEVRRYVMSNEGEGRYQLEIGNLPEGTYSFEGEASRGDRVIDTRSGRFTVGSLNREMINTIRNDELLRFISGTTGGTYLAHEQADDMLDILEEQLGFHERVEETARTLALHRHPFWFILVIVLLTIEWGLRKYRALA